MGANTTDEPWLAKLSELVELMAAWEPDGLILDFGCDALSGDPVGDLEISQDGLDRGARLVLERFAGLPTISLLCGGYVPGALQEAVRRHMLALAGLPRTPP